MSNEHNSQPVPKDVRAIHPANSIDIMALRPWDKNVMRINGVPLPVVMGYPVLVSPTDRVHHFIYNFRHTDRSWPARKERQFNKILDQADVYINGYKPWDIQVTNPNAYRRILRDGILGAGEAYMEGEWECEDLSGMIARVTAADLEGQFSGNLLSMAGIAVDSVFERMRTRFDRDAPTRALAAKHYDLGNNFFESFLGETMVYSSAMWGDAGWGSAQTLEEAQVRKLDIICRKLGLKPRMWVLDIGGGWGSFAIFAATEYGVNVVSTSISPEQVKFAEERRQQLPEDVAKRIEFRLQDYRDIDQKFSRIVSIGMFEHVGRKNHRAFFESVDRNLTTDGVFVLHSITTDRPEKTTSDNWVTKHIFPGSEIPNTHDMDAPLGKSNRWKLRMNQKSNYPTNYDRTLMEWFKRFDEHWEEFKPMFEPDADRFYRMWKFYLLGSAGAFRSGKLRLEQAIYTRDSSREPLLYGVEYYQHPEEPIKTSFVFPH